MPYYGRYADPTEQYQGTAFDPLTGRLQGGQMIQQILAQIAGNKRKKKEEEWELEDRAWQGKQRGMAEEQAGREREQYEWEKTNRVSPDSPAMVEFKKRLGENRAQKRALELERERTKGDLELEKLRQQESGKANKAAADQLRKSYLTAKTKIETDYTNDLNAVATEYEKTLAEVKKRGTMYPTIKKPTAAGSSYMTELTGAMSRRKVRQRELAARKAQQLAELERIYAEKAEMIGQGESQTQPSQQGQIGQQIYINDKGEKIVWDGTAWVPIR